MEKYIHFTNFNVYNIEKIFKYGIRTPFNLMINGIHKIQFNDTHNGIFFTSLTKKTDCNRSIYKAFISNPYYIGIEIKIDKVYKTSKNYKLFTNTPIPLRYSPYNDEWQTNQTIFPDNFTSIYYSLESAKKIYNEKEYEEILKKLNELKKLLELYNLNIPLITKEKVYTK